VPGRPDALPGGDAGWKRIRRGAGSRSVHSSFNKGWSISLFWRYARFRLHAGSLAMDSLGRIHGCLVVLALAMALPWSEPEVAGWRGAGNSVNKALCCGSIILVFSATSGHHGGGRRTGVMGVRDPGDARGAASGSASSAAFAPSTSPAEGRPLPPWKPSYAGRRKVFNLQAMPNWRPSRSSVVGSRCCDPSGHVPGVAAVDHGWKLRELGGDGAGPYRFLQFRSEVLCAKCQGLVVIFFLCGVLSVSCNFTDRY
jgi:hypothetical protein